MSLVFVFLLTVSAYAHPGKTDYRGGHKCLKNCSEWELEHEEYHLHDKDWKPIRLNEKGEPIKPYNVAAASGQEFSAQTQTVVTTSEKSQKVPASYVKRINESVQNTVIYEESILPFNVILLLLLALLLLTVLIFIRKRK